ncbi:MAG: hypothetical protein J6Y62_04075 [Clostridia bacterium]|nr:hypothetical protein [Clostridia bacterium]
MAKEKNKVKPKYFCGKDERIEVTVTGFYDKEDGDLRFVIPDKVEEPEDALEKVFHVFRFKPVNYNSLCYYRQNCAVQVRDGDRFKLVTDDIKLNKFLWTFHLADWNFEDDKGKVVLVFDPDGSLSAESFDKLYSVKPKILDAAIAEFRRKMSID